MDDDPVHRRRLLPLPGPYGRPRGLPPPPPAAGPIWTPNIRRSVTVHPIIPSPPTSHPVAADLSSSSSLRRLPPSLRLPPAHPASVASRFVPCFGYSLAPPPAPFPAAASGGSGSHHPRSLSQPQFLSMDFLFRASYPDLAAPSAIALSSPPPPPLSSGSDRGPSGLPPPSGSDRMASGLPPLRAGHLRSQSDVLQGFSYQPNLPPPAPVNAEALVAANNSTLDGILGAYMSTNGLGAVGSSGAVGQERRDQLDSQAPAWSPGDSSENEAESANGSLPRHCRSLSADSLVGKFKFGPSGLEPSNSDSNLPPPSPGTAAASRLARSGSGSIGGAAALFAKEFANTKEFSEADKKVIMDSEHLAQIVLTDPKRVRRILNNRQSAAKSKERKARYIVELEGKVQVLQGETMNLSAQVKMVKKGQTRLSIHNHEMRIRMQALEEQAQLKNALNEALNAEVERLKQLVAEASNHHMPNGSEQGMSSRMIQLHQLQIQRQPSQLQQGQQRQRNF
ncbi:bZIP transcription factor 29-like [Hordeum vulgare subsp. vulgare]|uniref:BZIP domain-containing protein n=1 Tax=Hordeum vulgare subsp. vulgare TaxID=112509 RepID=A0A8I6XUV4_HORVV|nr:bZIP transcription factor 29-like [Hordeum vulgare subsp. vulgare]